MDSLEKVQAVFKLLTEDAVDYMEAERLPQLSPDTARALIRHMQDRIEIFPSNIAACVLCGEYFNEDDDGHFTDKTDEPDEWHDHQGITQADIAQHGNVNFCCASCEAEYFAERKTKEVTGMTTPQSDFTEALDKFLIENTTELPRTAYIFKCPCCACDIKFEEAAIFAFDWDYDSLSVSTLCFCPECAKYYTTKF